MMATSRLCMPDGSGCALKSTPQPCPPPRVSLSSTLRARSVLSLALLLSLAATVWLNGRQIATHGGAFLPWEVNLAGLHGGVNTLVVRVDDRTTANSLPPGPGSNWWNFGGILREVYLRAVAKVDLQQVQIRPLLPCPGCAAT